jgi:hypothetical protein
MAGTGLGLRARRDVNRSELEGYHVLFAARTGGRRQSVGGESGGHFGGCDGECMGFEGIPNSLKSVSCCFRSGYLRVLIPPFAGSDPATPAKFLE